MLKIDRTKKAFSCLESPSLADASIMEVGDLQEYICNSPESFFEEIGQELFFIDKEVKPSDEVEDRIDILAVDKEGQAVIIELKRGSHKLQMFQAISYAGMISEWRLDDFLACLDADRKDKLFDFLSIAPESINSHQRLILVAEAFDYSVLIGADWLTTKHGVDIQCCRIALAKDKADGNEYLVCSNIFPAPELAEQAIRRGGGRSTRPAQWSNWDEALQPVTNPAAVEYVKQELEAQREYYLKERTLKYRIRDTLRWNLSIRQAKGYVWQKGRFDGDIDFWKSGLSQPDLVESVEENECLRFYLESEHDFEFFRQAVTERLLNARWVTEGEVDDEGES